MKLKDAPKDKKITHPKMRKDLFLKYSHGNPYDQTGWYVYESKIDEHGVSFLKNHGWAILTDYDNNIDDSWTIKE